MQPARLLCPWILQARILEWVAKPSFRASSQPRNQTLVFYVYLHWQVASLPLMPRGKPSGSLVRYNFKFQPHIHFKDSSPSLGLFDMLWKISRGEKGGYSLCFPPLPPHLEISGPCLLGGGKADKKGSGLSCCLKNMSMSRSPDPVIMNLFGIFPSVIKLRIFKKLFICLCVLFMTVWVSVAAVSRGFACCRAWVLSAGVSVLAALELSSCGAWA